jgi:hypothetical protein
MGCAGSIAGGVAHALHAWKAVAMVGASAVNGEKTSAFGGVAPAPLCESRVLISSLCQCLPHRKQSHLSSRRPTSPDLKLADDTHDIYDGQCHAQCLRTARPPSQRRLTHAWLPDPP